MKARGICISFAAAAAWLAIMPSADAHRLDEYLQATLISVDTDRVDLEINLTPGIAVASEVFGWIDTNRDREISPAEGESYARQMLSSVALSVDGRSVPVTLVDTRFPLFSDMSQGTGTIRLRATATIPAAYGFHQVSFLNVHRPEASVYLVNALVPSNPRIRLADQQRDNLQHRLTLNYMVSAAAPPAWFLPLLAGFAGLAIAARLTWAAVRSRRREGYAGAQLDSPSPTILGSCPESIAGVLSKSGTAVADSFGVSLPD
jgi:hypothetical protein